MEALSNANAERCCDNAATRHGVLAHALRGLPRRQNLPRVLNRRKDIRLLNSAIESYRISFVRKF